MLSAASGVVVVSVEDDSPAARAGIRPRDVITAVDDEPVKDRERVPRGDQKGRPHGGSRVTSSVRTGKTFALIKAD